MVSHTLRRCNDAAVRALPRPLAWHRPRYSLLDREFSHCVFLTKCTRPSEHGCSCLRSSTSAAGDILIPLYLIFTTRSGAAHRSRLQRSQPALPEAEEGALKARLHTCAAGRAFHAQGARRVDICADFVRQVFANDHNLGALAENAGLKCSACRPSLRSPAGEKRTWPRAWPRTRVLGLVLIPQNRRIYHTGSNRRYDISTVTE